MADELNAAITQVKTDVATLTSNVNKVSLGQPMTALPSATHNKAEAFVYMVSGKPLNDTLTSTSEKHRVDIRFYWLLQEPNKEVVEQEMAQLWDVLMTKFFGDDADRNLTEKCTLCLIGDETGGSGYVCGYEMIGGKLHRVLVVPCEIILDTHGV